MVSKICDKLMVRVRAKMPDVDDERAEVIRFGLELLIGEVPKIFVVFGISYLLGIIQYTILSLLVILPYRYFSGGLHLKTHIGCIIGTTVFYCGTAYLSKIIVFPNIQIKIIFVILALIFAFSMITLYAPADTLNIPILRKKERRNKKIGSYIVVVAMLISSFFIKDNTIANMLVIAVFVQSFSISRFAYNIFKLKFGYLEEIKMQKNAI